MITELAKRSIVGAILIVVALALSAIGGTGFALMIALAATVMYVEWTRIVRQWGFGW